MDIVFGEQISTPGFDYIALADDAHHKFSEAATPYRFAVDYFPPRECQSLVCTCISLRETVKT